LFERLAGGALVLRQNILVRHARRAGDTGTTRLALLALGLAALTLLPLNTVGLALWIFGIERLENFVALAAALATATIGLVWVAAGHILRTGRSTGRSRLRPYLSLSALLALLALLAFLPLLTLLAFLPLLTLLALLTFLPLLTLLAFLPLLTLLTLLALLAFLTLLTFLTLLALLILLLLLAGLGDVLAALLKLREGLLHGLLIGLLLLRLLHALRGIIKRLLGLLQIALVERAGSVLQILCQLWLALPELRGLLAQLFGELLLLLGRHLTELFGEPAQIFRPLLDAWALRGRLAGH